jgi:hypothetical protein
MSLTTIRIRVSNKNLNILAKSNLGKKEIDIPVNEINQYFETVYTCLEEIKDSKNFLPAIKELSSKVIQPFANILEKTDHICFIIEPKIVRHLYDVLELNGKPLFLNYAITYIISEFEIDEEPEVVIEDAFIVSDVTCDPEKACKNLHSQISKTGSSEYYEMEDISVEDITEGADDISLLLISSHGGFDDDESSEITINDESMTAEEMAELDCSIIYCDSCQMGVATDFLEAFAENESTQYYLAPVISNDAGDSSTLTIQWFFENLKKTRNPAQSLFATRKKLYQHYTAKKLSNIATLNKSFPFRLYEFECEEE